MSAILSQLQNDKSWPINFTTLVLKRGQINCIATENKNCGQLCFVRGLLAVSFTVENFVAVHAATKWLITVKMINVLVLLDGC